MYTIYTYIEKTGFFDKNLIKCKFSQHPLDTETESTNSWKVRLVKLRHFVNLKEVTLFLICSKKVSEFQDTFRTEVDVLKDSDMCRVE